MCTSKLIPVCSPSQASVPTALALGSFDGLHAGHRRVIEAITNTNKGVPTVVTFWPHPREVLYEETRLRIDMPSEKAYLLKSLNVQQLILISFTKTLAQLSAEDFVKKMLLKTLKAKKIAVGQNFRFGRNREGDAHLLKEIANKENVEVCIIPILKDQKGRMSSSRIRKALNDGELNIAKQLMGRPYRLQGRVVPGRGLGNSIGWPTANLEIEGRKFLPGIGVYSAWAWIKDNQIKFPAVMNLGPQPTVDPQAPSALEVHLLDQEIDLKGSELIIEPVKRLRGQHRFKDLQELSNQIKLDALLAKETLRAS